MGYRFRLHKAALPGKPDLVFASRRKVIFVHGCFWHRHPDPNCRLARLPKSRQDFWIPKLEGNRDRDVRNEAALTALGWRVLDDLGMPAAGRGFHSERTKNILELMNSIELFAGAGGPWNGPAQGGLPPAKVVEWDHDCCETLRENQAFDHPVVATGR